MHVESMDSVHAGREREREREFALRKFILLFIAKIGTSKVTMNVRQGQITYGTNYVERITYIDDYEVSR